MCVRDSMEMKNKNLCMTLFHESRIFHEKVLCRVQSNARKIGQIINCGMRKSFSKLMTSKLLATNSRMYLMIGKNEKENKL